MDSEIFTYLLQIAQWCIIGLITIVCWGLKDKFIKTDAAIEHIKENYVKKDFLKINIEHIRETIAASEKRILDKIDYLTSTFKK